MKKSSFALPEKAPGSGSYPIPDANHGRVAKSYVRQHGSPSEIKRVDRAVKKKFGFED